VAITIQRGRRTTLNNWKLIKKGPIFVKNCLIPPNHMQEERIFPKKHLGNTARSTEVRLYTDARLNSEVVNYGPRIVTVVGLSIKFLLSTEISKVDSAMLSSPQSVMIASNTQWEGSILDSSRDYTIKGSYGDANFDINCNDGGPFSVVFSKEGGFGYLNISLVKSCKVMDTQTTMDSFGGVQISGYC
jgi:hypothetical protein